MDTPLCTEIAASWELWQEYVDPDANMTESEFDEMSFGDALNTIHECFPSDCNCE